MSSGPSKSEATSLDQFQMPRVGDTLESRYEITNALASGGMGVILQARHLRMGRDVAVKILHPHIAQDETVVARFEREVSLAQKLSHPNSIRLYDFGEAENGLIYVVMELLDGADLKEIIAEEGPLCVGRVVDLILQVLDGLGEAHEQDFVHRDLKPSNLFITRDRRGRELVKILDFGIAKSLEEGAVDVTASGSFCGTAAYVAPEYMHDPTPQKAADVYAVGLIMLELLAGRRVFRGSTTVQTLMMQIQREVNIPAPIAATPLGEVIARAARKDPNKRYQDADQMFEALEAIVDELPADLRLAEDQVGELLCPPSATLPGMGQSAASPPHNPQDSSSSLPQVDGTPKDLQVGLSGSASTDMPETTIVTPANSFIQPDDEVALEEARNQQSSGSPMSRFVWSGLVFGVVVLAAGAFLLDRGAGGDEAVRAEESAQRPEPPRAAPQHSDAPKAQAPTDDEVAHDSPEAPAEVAPEASTLLEFRIESSPPAATVYDGDERLGVTPLERALEPDELPRTLRLQKEGYEDASTELAAGSESLLRVTLVERPKPRRRLEQPPQDKAGQPSQTRPERRAGEEEPKKSKVNFDEFLDEHL
jgi:eukaryotic-like serine/threonine-protein kinase